MIVSVVKVILIRQHSLHTQIIFYDPITKFKTDMSAVMLLILVFKSQI